MSYIERCLIRVDQSGLEKYSPAGSFRVDFVTPIREVLRRRRGLNKRRIIGLAAPTGVGKTTFLVALTSWLAATCDIKSTVLVAGKANRASMLIKYLETIARAKEAGLKAPRVLVFSSKIDTCIYDNLQDIIQAYRTAEDQDDAKKLANMFYQKERRVKDKCPHRNVEEKYEEVRRYVKDYSILLIGALPDSFEERVKKEAPTAYKLLQRGEKLIANIVELGRKFGICPYEIGKTMLADTELIDIVVLDNTYLLYRTEPGFMDVFTKSRLVVVDEVHESLFTSKVKVTIDYSGEERNILDRVAPEAVKLIAEAIEEIFAMDKDNLDKQTIRIDNVNYVYAVPETSLTPGTRAYDLIKEAVRKARRAMKKLGRVPLSLEAEVFALEAILEFERMSYKVSRADREIKPGTIVAVREYVDGKLVREHLIPTLLSPRLHEGEDFGFAIASSGTLLPVHLNLVFKIRRDEAENLMAVVKWPVILENRENYIIDYPAYFPDRPEVAAAIRRAVEDVPYTVIVIAALSWRKHLPEFTPITTSPQYVKTAEDIMRIRKLILSERARVLMSPHMGIAKGEDLVPPDVPFKALAIAASESIIPPNPDNIADQAIVARKYPLVCNKYYIAWQVVFVTRSMMKVVQAVGRVQRSEKHKLRVVYIGKFFKQKLKYFEELYGPVHYLSASNTQELENHIRQIAGW